MSGEDRTQQCPQDTPPSIVSSSATSSPSSTSSCSSPADAAMAAPAAVDEAVGASSSSSSSNSGGGGGVAPAVVHAPRGVEFSGVVADTARPFGGSRTSSGHPLGHAADYAGFGVLTAGFKDTLSGVSSVSMPGCASSPACPDASGPGASAASFDAPACSVFSEVSGRGASFTGLCSSASTAVARAGAGSPTSTRSLPLSSAPSEVLRVSPSPSLSIISSLSTARCLNVSDSGVSTNSSSSVSSSSSGGVSTSSSSVSTGLGASVGPSSLGPLLAGSSSSVPVSGAASSSSSSAFSVTSMSASLAGGVAEVPLAVSSYPNYSNGSSSIKPFPNTNNNNYHHTQQYHHHQRSSSNVSADPNEVFRSEQHALLSLERMRRFYIGGQLCDVTLVACGGQRFPAHRLVLSAASDYFSAMFTTGLAEATQEEVALPHVDAASLDTLLHYCYTGELEVRESSVESLLSTAHQLLLGEVVSVCCDFLASQLHPTNCIGIQLFADSQGCHSLLRAAQRYTAHHFAAVCSQQEFVQLRLPELRTLLSSDDLNVASEETIVQAVTAWLEHDLAERRQHAANVLALVRLPLLHPHYISDYVESNPLFKDDLKCQQLVLEALKHHLKVPLPVGAGEEVLMRARPRKSTVGTLYIVGGMDASKAPVEVLQYDYRLDAWQPLAGSTPSASPSTPSSAPATPSSSSSTRRLQCGGGVVGGRLHIVGGRDGLKTLNTVECWDHVTGHWSQLPNMATHRHGLGVGVLGGVVYSVGGHDGWSYLNTVERWDPGARVWTYVAPMSAPRSSLGVGVLGGKLYAVGGRDGSSCLRSVECYDPLTNRWSPCAPLNRRRGGVAVGVLDGYLYAVGGHDAPASSPTVNRLDCVERYDPATDSWSLVSPGLRVGCDSTSVCTLGDELLVCVGGYTGTSYLTHVQAYHPATNTWTHLAPLPTGRAGACTVVIR